LKDRPSSTTRSSRTLGPLTSLPGAKQAEKWEGLAIGPQLWGGRRLILLGNDNDYSVTQTYLNAVKATGSDDGDKVLDHMRKTKINDMYAKGGYIRPDGRMVHEMYLMQVKTPAESKEPWDYYNVAAKIKGEDAFTTKAESKCALWK